MFTITLIVFMNGRVGPTTFGRVVLMNPCIEIVDFDILDKSVRTDHYHPSIVLHDIGSEFLFRYNLMDVKSLLVWQLTAGQDVYHALLSADH